MRSLMHSNWLTLTDCCPAAAPTLAFIGLLWKSLRNLQFEMQVRSCKSLLLHRSTQREAFCHPCRHCLTPVLVPLRDICLKADSTFASTYVCAFKLPK